MDSATAYTTNRESIAFEQLRTILQAALISAGSGRCAETVNLIDRCFDVMTIAEAESPPLGELIADETDGAKILEALFAAKHNGDELEMTWLNTRQWRNLTAHLRTQLAVRAIDPVVLERIRNHVKSAKEKRFIAVALDLPDVEAMLTALGGQNA